MAPDRRAPAGRPGGWREVMLQSSTPLFWTPPATPRGASFPRPRETPVRAIHPADLSKTEHRVVAAPRGCPWLLDTHALRRSVPTPSPTLMSPAQVTHPPVVPAQMGPRPQACPIRGDLPGSPLVTPRASLSQCFSANYPDKVGLPRKQPPWK